VNNSVVPPTTEQKSRTGGEARVGGARAGSMILVKVPNGDTSNIVFWSENSRIESSRPCVLIAIFENSHTLELTASPGDVETYCKAIARVDHCGRVEHVFVNTGDIFYCSWCREASYVELTEYGATAKHGKIEVMTDNEIIFKTEYETLRFVYVDTDDFKPELTGWYKEEEEQAQA